MTISHRMLLSLLALVAGAVGLAMYVGLRIGLDASAAQAGPQVLAMAPTAAAAPIAPAPAVATDPATLTTDQCAFLMAVDNTDAGATGDNGIAGAWYDTGAEVSVEEGDFATNSGIIDGSQFNDGGFGDIGQQWWGVTVNGNVTNVNVDQGGTANVNVGADQVAPAPTPPVPTPTPDPQPVAAPTPTQPVAAPTPAAPVGSPGDAPTGTASAGAADAASVLADSAT